jgi:hypothetical protein
MKKTISYLSRSLLTLLLTLNLTGCGYSTVQPDDKTTVSIPYIEGDHEGQLTAELARQLNASGVYDLVSSGGDLVLKVALIGERNDIIGFRYDRSEVSEKLEKNLLATENRKVLSAQITLVRPISEEVVLGPIMISGFADYDYIDVSTLRELAYITPSGKREKVIDFSLGQLDSVEGAQDTVLTPAYRQLAQKIIAAIQRSTFKDSSDD